MCHWKGCIRSNAGRASLRPLPGLPGESRQAVFNLRPQLLSSPTGRPVTQANERLLSPAEGFLHMITVPLEVLGQVKTRLWITRGLLAPRLPDFDRLLSLAHLLKVACECAQGIHTQP